MITIYIIFTIYIIITILIVQLQLYNCVPAGAAVLDHRGDEAARPPLF